MDYDSIEDEQDRTQSMALVARLANPQTPYTERLRIIEVLGVLEDPRTTQPLTDILLDASMSDDIRRAAGDALNHFVVPSTLKAWWNGEDTVLREHAFSLMGPNEAEIVEAVAGDPDHPLYLDAVERLAFGFEQPRHQQLKVKALNHANSAVREAAIFALVLDEPLIAEEPLLRTTRDPDTAVAQQAAAALAYYPTQRVLHRLDEMRTQHPREEVRSTAEQTLLWFLRDAFCIQAVDPHVRAWMAPTADLLDCESWDIDTLEGTSPDPAPEQIPISLDDVREVLNNRDITPAALVDFFQRAEWSAIDEGNRADLARRMADYDDPLVRGGAARALVEWGRFSDVVAMLDDPYVMHDAAEALKRVEPSAFIATALWDHLRMPNVYGVHAADTLEAYVHHSIRQQAVPRLEEIAANPTRDESLRLQALIGLARLEALDELEGLLWIVEEEPLVTWALHLELLDSVAIFGLRPPETAHLHTIDHLEVQAALSPLR